MEDKAQSYRTLRAAGQNEFSARKSRFIGCASPANDEAEALAFLVSVRTRYKDANHHCYAYIIGRNAGVIRYSDAGEPGGTAGIPILGALVAASAAVTTGNRILGLAAVFIAAINIVGGFGVTHKMLKMFRKEDK
jgi:hypothetical protein